MIYKLNDSPTIRFRAALFRTTIFVTIRCHEWRIRSFLNLLQTAEEAQFRSIDHPVFSNWRPATTNSLVRRIQLASLLSTDRSEACDTTDKHVFARRSRKITADKFRLISPTRQSLHSNFAQVDDKSGIF